MIKDYGSNPRIECDEKLLDKLALDVAITSVFDGEASDMSRRFELAAAEFRRNNHMNMNQRQKGSRGDILETGLFELFVTTFTGLRKSYSVLFESIKSKQFWSLGMNRFSSIKYPLMFYNSQASDHDYQFQRISLNTTTSRNNITSDVIMLTKVLKVNIPDKNGDKTINGEKYSRVNYGVVGALIDRDQFLKWMGGKLAQDVKNFYRACWFKNKKRVRTIKFCSWS